MVTKKIRVEGKVQGVFYRKSAQEKAREIGITGWVRNTEDGHVEMLATGTESQLQELIRWCYQGPPAAVVTHIHVTPADGATGPDFVVLK